MVKSRFVLTDFLCLQSTSDLKMKESLVTALLTIRLRGWRYFVNFFGRQESALLENKGSWSCFSALYLCMCPYFCSCKSYGSCLVANVLVCMLNISMHYVPLFLIISVATVVDCLLKFSIENGLKNGPIYWVDTADIHPCIGKEVVYLSQVTW